MTEMPFDVLVIGSGPAGEKAAIQAAKLGRRAAVVDKPGRLGGNCLHTATIPSKTLREAILHLTAARRHVANGLGKALSRHATLEALRHRTRAVVAVQEDRVLRHLDRNEVTQIEGTARFVDPHRVEVTTADGGTLLARADVIVVATGSRPARDAHIPFDDVQVHDSDTFLHMTALPKRLTVVGAGVIGCEYASMFAAIGVKVTLVDSRPTLLSLVDREMADMLVARMRDQGVIMRLGERSHQLRGVHSVGADATSG